MNIRGRLENSRILAAILSWTLASYLRLCFATSRATIEGIDDLKADLKNGPIMLVLWHGRLAAGPNAWPFQVCGFTSIHDTSVAGRIGAETFKRLGIDAFQFKTTWDGPSASKKIMKSIRGGNCLGMAADGPNGPATKVGQATIDWARVTGRQVFLFSWSARRALRLDTWDNLWLPLPFSPATFAFRKWDAEIPRRLDKADSERLKIDLENHLNALVQELDTLVGAPVEKNG